MFHMFQCGEQFSDKHKLNRHKTIHQERTLQCDVCQQQFNKREHLLRHVAAKHTNKRPYQCEQCDKAFTRSDKLKEHVTSKHTAQADKPYKCDICGRG